MYVLIDFEWFSTADHRIYPTQIAALRVNEHFESLSVFSELIAPPRGIDFSWDHAAFAGYSPDDFLRARSAYSVFSDFMNWLMPDDVLCWWTFFPETKLRMLMKIILKKDILLKRREIRSYFDACTNDGKTRKGTPFALATKRQIDIPPIEHCAMYDVITIKKLLMNTGFDLSVLNGPIPERVKETVQPVEPPLFLCDENTQLLHVPDSECIKQDMLLKHMITIKSCMSKGYKPCPLCAKEKWKEESMEYNRQNLSKRDCSYFFFPESKVFHVETCHVIAHASKIFQGAVYYNTCIKSGRTPCKICKPIPGLVKTIILKDTTDNPDGNQSTPRLTKLEKLAYERHKLAVAEWEMSYSEDMNAEERKDVRTLTNTRYSFLAAQGYQTFHLRNCWKLSGLSALKGFESYHHAINSGYQPCRECKPSSKHDVKVSMPTETRKRENETREGILDLCSQLFSEYNYEEPLLYLHTHMADWKINIATVPVILEHKPATSPSYHRQHKMFLSVTDALYYIRKHDRFSRKSLEQMLMDMKREE